MAEDDSRAKKLEIAGRATETIKQIPAMAEMTQRLHVVRGQMAEVVEASLAEHPADIFNDQQKKAMIDCLALMTVTLHPSQKRRGWAKLRHEFAELALPQKMAVIVGSLTVAGALAAGIGFGAAHLQDIRAWAVYTLGGKITEVAPPDNSGQDLLGNSSIETGM